MQLCGANVHQLRATQPRPEVRGSVSETAPWIGLRRSALVAVDHMHRAPAGQIPRSRAAEGGDATPTRAWRRNRDDASYATRRHTPRHATPRHATRRYATPRRHATRTAKRGATLRYAEDASRTTRRGRREPGDVSNTTRGRADDARPAMQRGQRGRRERRARPELGDATPATRRPGDAKRSGELGGEGDRRHRGERA